MSRSQWLRGVVVTVLMATSFTPAWGQQAAAPSATTQQKISLDIPSQSVVGALTALGQQSGLTIMLAAAAKSDATSPAVVGDYTPDQALKRILTASGLKAEYLDSKTVAIRTVEAPKPATDSSTGTKSPTGAQETGHQEVDKEVPGPTQQTSEQPPQTSNEQPLDERRGMAEILIKGSRTTNIDVVRSEEDVQPYTIFDSRKIEQSGATNVEDFLKQQLTMNTQVQTSAQAYQSFTGTTSSINLRGLGSNETLILIDGRRSAGVDNAVFNSVNQPDINGIPLSAIERIEVLPSSASAIYGGAAVGGVVNIILKKNFNGGNFSYTEDRPVSSNAYQRTVNASYGISFEEGTQIMVGGQYSKGSPLLLQDRQDLFARGVSTILNNSPSLIYSPSQPFSGSTPNIASAASFDFTCFCFPPPSPLTLKNGTSLNSPITSVPAGAAPGSDLSSGLAANAGKYNLNLSPGIGLFGLHSPFGTVPTTKSGFATIRQSLFDDVQLFAEFSANSNVGHTFFNPFDSVFTIPSTAPTSPFQQDVSIAFPSSVASPQDTDSVTRSATVGLVGQLVGGWSSEIDYTWSKNTFDLTAQAPDSTALNSALSDGTLNPFADTIANTLNLTPFLASHRYSGYSTLNDVNLRASGPVGSLPAGRPTLTVGLEHRREGSGNATDQFDYPLTPDNNEEQIFFGQSQSTDSVYAEGLVPLVGPQNHVPAIDALELQVAGRSEHYTVHAGTPYMHVLPVAFQITDPLQGVHTTIDYTSTNPVVGLKYQPVREVILRASYSTAFLPPTAAELLPNPTPLCGFPCQQITDPKNGQTYNIDLTQGGNPQLKPQKSRDLDLGMIWEPGDPAFAGLRMDLEYYRITQPNYITNPTVQQVVSDPSLASRVTRDPTTGLVTIADTSFVNATEYKTSGWDLKIDYRKETGFGTLDLHAAGTLIKNDQRQYSIASPFLEYAGYPNDGGEGKIKGNATLSWEYHGWTAAWTTTYYSSYWQQFAPGGPLYIQFGPNTSLTDAQGSYSIPAQTYHDIFVSYTFGSGVATRHLVNALLSNLTLQFGIKNIFDTKPPFDALYKPYYYSPLGDARLRDFRFTLSKGF